MRARCLDRDGATHRRGSDLPLNCEIVEGAGRQRRVGIRYHKEKSAGGEKQLSTRWLTARQGELVEAALTEARRLTGEARTQAKVLEANLLTVVLPGVSELEELSIDRVAMTLGVTPGNVRRLIRNGSLPQCKTGEIPAANLMAYLQSARGPIWVIDRRNGSKQSLSESLFIQYRNAGARCRTASKLLVVAIRTLAVNDFLRGRNPGGERIRSAFERFGYRDQNGEFFSMSSHQFRHWITTKAAQTGVPDYVINRWQGREHLGDLDAYKHLSTAERLNSLKDALRGGRVKGELAQMYFSLKEDLRDVFLEGQVQAVHVTPLGLCVHDFKVAPCPKFLNCVKDCGDYLLDTSNKAHLANLVQLQSRTRETLQQALKQRQSSDQNLSEAWIADAEATLRGVGKILESALTKDRGILKPFNEEPSKFLNLEQGNASA